MEGKEPSPETQVIKTEVIHGHVRGGAMSPWTSLTGSEYGHPKSLGPWPGICLPCQVMGGGGWGT